MQDGTVRIWNTETFTLDRVIQCADEGCSVLALVVYDSVLYTTSSDNKMRMWDLESGNYECIGEARTASLGHPLALAVCGEDVYIGFQDTSLRKFTVAQVLSKKPTEKFHPERLSSGDPSQHHCGPVQALVYYDDKYLVSGAGDGLVKVWCPTLKSCIRTMQVSS